MWRNWLKASAIIGALGSVALMVAQTIFQDWWDSSESEARAKLDRQQTEYLSRSVEAIDRSTEAVAKLNQRLEEIARRTQPVERQEAAPPPEAPTTKPADALVVQDTEVAPVATASPARREAQEEGRQTVEAAAPPPAPAREDAQPEAPPQAQQPPESPPVVTARGPDEAAFDDDDVFGVFEAQSFDLCGYTGFKAELVGSGGAAEVHLSSRNRGIPGAGFRGFEKRLPLKEPAELWSGCTVAIGAVEATGRTRRLIISVAEGKKV